MALPLSQDTSSDMERLLVEGWRRMSSERKAATVTALTSMAMTMTMAGLRQRHPGESAESLRRRLATLLYGSDVAARLRTGGPAS